MRLALFLVFLAVPLVELALLVKLGQWIGFWPTLGIVVATAIIGATILHRQGVATLRRAVEMTERGAAPLAPALDGVFLLFAGALLLTPGLITDLTGVLLLIPPIRRAVAQWAFASLMRRATVEVHVARRSRAQRSGPWPPQREPPATGADNGTIIEGEFERVDERDATRRPGAGDPKH